MSPPGRFCASISGPRVALLNDCRTHLVILSVSRWQVSSERSLFPTGFNLDTVGYPAWLFFACGRARHPPQAKFLEGHCQFHEVKSHSLFRPYRPTVLLPSLGATYRLFVPCTNSVLSRPLTIACVHSAWSMHSWPFVGLG